MESESSLVMGGNSCCRSSGVFVSLSVSVSLFVGLYYIDSSRKRKGSGSTSEERRDRSGKKHKHTIKSSRHKSSKEKKVCFSFRSLE